MEVIPPSLLIKGGNDVSAVREMVIKDTVEMMLSSDPVERLEGEYHQARIRTKSLEQFLYKYGSGHRELPPYTDFNTLHRQFQTMCVYENILKERLEKIKLAGVEA